MENPLEEKKNRNVVYLRYIFTKYQLGGYLSSEWIDVSSVLTSFVLLQSLSNGSPVSSSVFTNDSDLLGSLSSHLWY